jgi:hypothetical protein
MNLPLRIALLSMIVMVSGLLSFTETKKLSPSAQAAVSKKLSDSSSSELFAFDKDGSVQTTYSLDSTQLQNYDTLSDLLKSKKSPVPDCKDPTPTPPPGCVNCGNGRIICNRSAKFLKNWPDYKFQSTAPNKSQPQ